MPFSWRLSTSVSNFEANMDYRDVKDPAITVTMPLIDEPETALLVWTTPGPCHLILPSLSVETLNTSRLDDPMIDDLHHCKEGIHPR